MKAISSLIQSAILMASLSSTIGSQLRANWRVTYDTTNTCQFGTIAATVLKPSASTATSIVFRVADGGSSSTPYYTTSAKMQSTGKAKLSLPMTEAFKVASSSSSNLVCSIQFGTSTVTVSCPTLPVCKSPPTAAPTHAPTKAPTAAPTKAPVHPPTWSPTLNPLFDVTSTPGFINVCEDGYLTVNVLNNGQPVAGAALDLLVQGNLQYHVQGTTDAHGKATLFIALETTDRYWQARRSTLKVTNPNAPLGFQYFNPSMTFGCQKF